MSQALRSPKGTPSQKQISENLLDGEEFHPPVIERGIHKQVTPKQAHNPQIRTMSVPTTISYIKIKLLPAALLELQNDKLPGMHKKAPPEFNGNKPDNLLAWLAACEALFALNKIIENSAKKFLTLCCMSYRTQLEWKDHEILVSQMLTWEDFKSRLKKGYHETASEEIGLKQRVANLVETTKLIHCNELQKLQKYICAFKIEASKLMSGPQPVLSNIKAVRLFLAALNGAFVNTILDKAEPDPANKQDRREDNPLTLSEVITCTEMQARIWQGYASLLASTTEPTVLAMIYQPNPLAGTVKSKESLMMSGEGNSPSLRISMMLK